MKDSVRCYIATDENETPFVQVVPYGIVAILQSRGVPLRGVWMGKS